ncbi:ETS-related transcription factor Elf-4-like isoform X2 [Clytia hemisphaerica]|uniref:ETS domain-containing protein n=1 Tax=Clytia hemisphaerica TaxID=252671 RepID=A0A7M5WU57_9CNID
MTFIEEEILSIEDFELYLDDSEDSGAEDWIEQKPSPQEIHFEDYGFNFKFMNHQVSNPPINNNAHFMGGATTDIHHHHIPTQTFAPNATYNSYSFLFNSVVARDQSNTTATVNSGVSFDLQLPDIGQVDFDYLQKMQQESHFWDRFYQENLKQEEFDDNQATLNLPNQPGENSNLQQQQIASSPPSVQTNTIYHFPADTKEGIIPKPTPPSNNNNDSESTNLSTSRTSKRMQQKSYSTLKTNSKQNPGKKNKRRRRKNLLKPGSQLYQFILQLLDDESKRELIRWEKPRSTGIFRIINKEQVSQLWGDARKRTMTYDSLSRGLRHYYSQGLLNAVNKKLHYQFTQKALDEWEVIRHKDLIEER